MIDKTAIIDSKAKLDKNVQVGAYCVIGPDVEIGENTIIQSHVNISGNVKIGKGNIIYPFVSINDPQDLKYNGEHTNLIIGATSGIWSKLCHLDGFLYTIDVSKFGHMLGLADFHWDAFIWSWQKNNKQ